MKGYIDLHCHWVAGIDDGAPTSAESVDMLRALGAAGFSRVVATPHMRTGMFDNSKQDLLDAYQATLEVVEQVPDLPALGLSSEHHLDDVVFARLLAGAGLPYPGGHAALIEFPNERFPLHYQKRLFELRQRHLRPVLAHPERYRPVWQSQDILEPLLDGGTLLLLDVAALVGKYGRRAQSCSEQLLDDGYYYAACSDAHRAADAEPVAAGIAALHHRIGHEDAEFMLSEGPQRILDGRIDD